MGVLWGDMSWCFAKINGRTAEIYFDVGKDKHPKIRGHAYVCPEEFTTKKEQQLLREETERFRFSYRKGAYRYLS